MTKLGSADSLDVRGLLSATVIAAVNAAALLFTSEARRPMTRALAHLFDAGQILALGVCVVLATEIGRRLPSRWRRLDLGLLALAAAVIAPAALLEDTQPGALRLVGGPWGTPAAIFAAVALSTAVPISVWVGRRASSRSRRTVLVAAGVVGQIANHLVLPRNYPGVHLLVTVSAVALVATCLGRPRVAPWMARASLGAAFVGAALSLLVPVPSGVLVELFRHPGSSTAPFVARAHAASSRARPRTARAHRDPVPPTRPGLGLRDPIVVLLSIDCLRADVLRTDPGSMPTLLGLSAEAVRFEHARTPAPATMVALSSVFTGRYFSQLRWEPRPPSGDYFPHEDPAARFPAVLAHAGVATSIVKSAAWMDPSYGIVPGFDEVLQPVGSPAQAFVIAEVTTDAIVKRLARPRAGPSFVYAHFLDAHAPYDLDGTHGTAKEAYLRELTLVDRALGRVVTALEAPELRDRAVLIVTADHGEAFDEHATLFHGTTLYEEIMRVPLIVRAPGLAPAVITEPVTLMDLGPTLLDLFGVESPGDFMGASLVPLMLGSPLAIERPIVMDSGRRIQSMVFADGFKVIHDRRSGTSELYDLGDDPGERRNLYEELGEKPPHLEQLFEFFEEVTLTEGGYEPPLRRP